MRIKQAMLLSLAFFTLGIILTSSGMNSTGAVVGVSGASPSFSSGLGIVLILFSALILIESENLEDKLNIKSFRRKLEKIEKRQISYDEAKKGYESREIRKVTLKGEVPLTDAINIKEEGDRKVESGEWVEIYREEPRYAKDERYAKRMASARTRYFGPGEYVGKIPNIRQADKLVKRNLAGKIHEIIVPSETEYNDVSPDKIPAGEYRMYKKEDGKWVRKTAGKDKDFDGPMPNPKDEMISPEEAREKNHTGYLSGESFSGSQPLHRHWEIKQMYKGRKSQSK